MATAARNTSIQPSIRCGSFMADCLVQGLRTNTVTGNGIT
jgi:hypothetical protein